MESPEQSNYNLFLLGAGFTKAMFPDAPLNRDLLRVIFQGATITTLKKYCREHKTDDIEILLTRLDIEIASPKNRQKRNALQTVRRTIEQQLAEYLQRFRFEEELAKNNPWLESLAKELFVENDKIITTNYDCFLEGLLDYYEMWSPNGYAVIESFFARKLPQNPKNILIYKIHGSENFVIAGATDAPRKKALSFVVDGTIYPRSGKNRSYTYGGPDASPYIIAPSFVKIPHEDIEQMMIEALSAATLAKNLVIVGCSLRVEDSFLWLLVTNFLYQNKAGKRLIIVDPNAEEIRARINDHYFGDIEGFSAKPILFSNLASDYTELIKCLNNLRTS